jgi:anti-sigma-K factor RskA
MTNETNERQFVARIRAALDQSVEQLNPGVRSRLTRMRHDALARQTGPSSRRWHWRWGAALTAAVTAAALILLLPMNPRDAQSPLAVIDDMEMLASSDPLEIYEDMEFYSWLSDMENEIENS